jgi:cytidine deaminase
MNAPELYSLRPAGFEMTPAEEAAIPKLLGAAALASAAPRQSGFAVKAAAINIRGDVVHAGNREYGLSRAYVHGEEAVVSKLFSEYPGVPLLGIGIYDEEESPSRLLPCPCGNCRDVLLEEASPELLLVCGNERVAMAARLSEFLFESYAASDSAEILSSPVLSDGFDAALRANKRSMNASLPEQLLAKLYGVALIDRHGNIFSGSFDTTAAYDAITPGVAAIQSFRNRPKGEDGGLSNLAAVVIVGQDVRSVSPVYRDRNAIADLDEVLQSTDSEFLPTPVYGITVDGAGNPLAAFRTDTFEWLPHPFINGSIGLQEVARTKRQLLDKYI